MEDRETAGRAERAEESAQAHVECQCIETFLNWLNRRSGTGFRYRRAEDVCPELADSTRWDFIITQDGSPLWYAVEIKRLVRPQAMIQLVRWNRVLQSIANRLAGQLQGEFLIYGVPRLQLDRRQMAELKRIIAELVLQNAPSLGSGGQVDLGHQILGRFREWPSTPHLNMGLSPPMIEYRVNVDSCFTLHKVSSTGHSLELGFAQSEVFGLDQGVVEALASLFAEGEMSRANRQLKLARDMGAESTVLLMDYHLLSWYPNRVRQVIADGRNSSQLASIDCIYLVKASEDRVSRVWGMPPAS